MKIITTYFSYPGKDYNYDKLHKVFVESCKYHMPDIEVISLPLDVEVKKSNRKSGCWTNTAKLRAWIEVMREVDDDIIFADCDMLCVSPAYHAFNAKFDIAYTHKAKGVKESCSFNGGILMMRNTKLGRSWMEELNRINTEMLLDKDFHEEWKKHYFGMNQAAMGFMFNASNHPAKIHTYKTLEWNAVDSDWPHVNGNTIFVHCKGKLREYINLRMCTSEYEHLMKEWFRYDEDKNFKIITPQQDRNIIMVKPKKYPIGWTRKRL